MRFNVIIVRESKKIQCKKMNCDYSAGSKSTTSQQVSLVWHKDTGVVQSVTIKFIKKKWSVTLAGKPIKQLSVSPINKYTPYIKKTNVNFFLYKYLIISHWSMYNTNGYY